MREKTHTSAGENEPYCVLCWIFLAFANSGLSVFAFGRDRERTRDFYFLQTPVRIAALAMQTRFALQDPGGCVRTGWAQRGSGTRGSIWNWIPAGSPRVFSVPNGFDIFRRPSSADWVRLEKRRAPHIIEHDSRGTKCGSRFSHTQSRFSTLQYCNVLNRDCVCHFPLPHWAIACFREKRWVAHA